MKKNSFAEFVNTNVNYIVNNSFKKRSIHDNLNFCYDHMRLLGVVNKEIASYNDMYATVMSLVDKAKKEELDRLMALWLVELEFRNPEYVL